MTSRQNFCTQLGYKMSVVDDQISVSSFLELVRRLLWNHSAASRNRISVWFIVRDRRKVLGGRRKFPSLGRKVFRPWDGKFSVGLPAFPSASGLYDCFRTAVGKCPPQLIKRFVWNFEILLPEPGIEPGTPGWETSVLSSVLWPLADKSYFIWAFIYIGVRFKC